MYVSPGIGLSWNIGYGLTVAPKVSIGYAWDGRFANLTLSMASSPRDALFPCVFIECQYGVVSRVLEVRKTVPLCGGGFGLAVTSTKSGMKIYPRASAFVGWWAFVTADVMLADTLRSSVGVEVVLPIPLKKLDLGSISG
jgi:hypothetical protein